MPLLTLAIVIIAAVSGAFYYRTTREEAALPEASEATIDANVEPTTEVSAYADGTYTKTGTYVSPAGVEEVTISVTLAGDVITAAGFTGGATNPGSVNNQKKFAEGFEGEVVGKPIDAIALSVVNGSSLTPKGFMEALNEIKVEARI